MVIVENGVNYSIKRYNDLRVLVERRTAELKSRLDELDAQKKTFDQLDAMKKVRLFSIVAAVIAVYIRLFRFVSLFR